MLQEPKTNFFYDLNKASSWKTKQDDVRTPSDVQGRGRPAGDYK